MGHRHSEESNVGAAIHNHCVIGQRVDQCKNIGQLTFDVGTAGLDQSFGLEQTGSGHNKFAIHTV